MSKLLRTLVVGFAFALLPSLVCAQGTDLSEMDQWMKMTEHQTEPRVGATITMANWQHWSCRCEVRGWSSEASAKC